MDRSLVCKYGESCGHEFCSPELCPEHGDPEDVKNIIRIIESKSGFPREIDAKAQIFEGLENYGSNRSLAEEINHIMMGDVVEIKETIDQLWGICNPDPVIINPKGNPNNATGK